MPARLRLECGTPSDRSQHPSARFISLRCKYQPRPLFARWEPDRHWLAFQAFHAPLSLGLPTGPGDQAGWQGSYVGTGAHFPFQWLYPLCQNMTFQLHAGPEGNHPAPRDRNILAGPEVPPRGANTCPTSQPCQHLNFSILHFLPVPDIAHIKRIAAPSVTCRL